MDGGDLCSRSTGGVFGHGGGFAPIAHDPGTVIATSGVPAVAAAPPTQQPVPIGATVVIPVQTDMTDGTTVAGRAAFTVSNLRPITPTNTVSEVTGTFYAVDVTIQALSGTIVVHPFNFAVRTEDGTNLTPDITAVDNGLPATDLPQGQKVSGPIAVDVPTGKTITEIIAFSQIGGTQLGRWTVA